MAFAHQVQASPRIDAGDQPKGRTRALATADERDLAFEIGGAMPQDLVVAVPSANAKAARMNLQKIPFIAVH
jgi:hypothetical protein